jgi:phage tail-like protein
MPTKGVPVSSPHDALHARNFTIEIDGHDLGQFMEIAGMTSEVEVAEVQSNTAEGQYILKKIPGKPKPPTLTLKRGKDVSMELWKWHKAAIDGDIAGARKNGSIALHDFTHKEVARWNFTNAWCTKLTTSALGACKNEIITEEATIVMESFERIPK